MADRISIKLGGVEVFNGALDSARDQLKHALAQSMYLESERIMTKSKELAPVDDGTLRASGHVELPEISGDRIVVNMGYGGESDDYALIQHERLDFHHTVGQAKFLEQPALEAQSGLDARLAALMRAQGIS